ncbi:MAG: [Fe-Fe] hydrogenase large subunit C-terminal domain-containing protein [Oscillospiraceae bacterium]
MKKLMLEIDGRPISVPEGSTVLDAARALHIPIPTFCHVKCLSEGSVCRVCVVEDHRGELLAACGTPAREGMRIFTATERVMASRKQSLELLCENHRMDCDNCVRYRDCEFHRLCSACGINSDLYETYTRPEDADRSSPCLIRDSSKCVLCRRCEGACARQGLSLLSALGRGPQSQVGAGLPLGESGCIGCGQCVCVCPTGALYPADHTRRVWKWLLKKSVPVAAVVSPAAAGMVGECFHEAPGTGEPGKVPALLRRLGFDRVYAADSFDGRYYRALREEAAARERDALPLIAGVCPGIRSCIRRFRPDKEALLAQTPPPLCLLAEAIHAEAPDTAVVFIGSCTAVKEWTESLGLAAALTVPELAAMIDRACVSRASALEVWRRCKSEEFDLPPSMPEGGESGLPGEKLTGLAGFLERLCTDDFSCDIILPYACPEGCLNGGGQVRLPSGELSRKAYLERARD